MERTMINEELVRQTVAECARINPQSWMLSVGLTPEAERYLRDSATATVNAGASVSAVRMSGFQLGFEIARRLARAGELL